MRELLRVLISVGKGRCAPPQVAPLHQPHLWGQITALTHTHTHKLGIPSRISGKGRSQGLRAGVPMPAVGDTDDRKKKFRNFDKE